MQERPTFSPLWHRVRALRPRLRPHCQITRQHYRGRRWHVVHDPTSNQFYRLSPIAHEFVALLDGSRTVEDVWNFSLQSHGDAAPTQQEVIELLSQMYNTNLLSMDTTPETEQLLRRGRERVKRRVQQQAIGIMYFKVRLINPDRFLTWLEPVLRPLINRWGFLAWVLFVGWALTRVVPRWDDLQSMFEHTIAPGNWLWLGAVFVVVKAIHEIGHGVICKRFGGQVPELGVMLLVLVPAPYVDASACWAFPSKWQRMAVGAGGMIFELFIAAIATHIWLATATPGADASLLNQLAYNAMFTASISTVLFNANPLMRFDGYYILSDLLEVPNLMQRSMKMLQHLMQVHVYRITQSRPPTTMAGEAAVLIVYGLAALAYRIFLFFAITLFVMGKLFAVGLVLALWTAAVWFILPVGKFVHWLATSQQLSEFRPRAIMTSVGMIVTAAVLLGVVPLPDRRRADGVVESMSRTGLFFRVDGFVVQSHRGVGDRVQAGEAVLTLDNPDLRGRLRQAQAELALLESLELQYTATSPAAAQVARELLRLQKDLINEVHDRLDRLVVRAPHAGVLVQGERGADPRSLEGAYVRQGQLVCDIVDTHQTRVAAVLSTSQALPLAEAGAGAYGVRIRPVSAPEDEYVGHGKRLIEGAQRRLPHAALGHAGGGTVEIDPQDQAGVLARTSRFVLYLDEVVPLEDGGPAWAGAPGERVKLRIRLPARPLLGQWLDRLRQLLQGRADI